MKIKMDMKIVGTALAASAVTAIAAIPAGAEILGRSVFKAEIGGISESFTKTQREWVKYNESEGYQQLEDEQTAVRKVLELNDSDIEIVSSDYVAGRTDSYFRIGVRKAGDENAEIRYYLANNCYCVPEEGTAQDFSMSRDEWIAFTRTEAHRIWAEEQDAAEKTLETVGSGKQIVSSEYLEEGDDCYFRFGIRPLNDSTSEIQYYRANSSYCVAE